MGNEFSSIIYPRFSSPAIIEKLAFSNILKQQTEAATTCIYQPLSFCTKRPFRRSRLTLSFPLAFVLEFISIRQGTDFTEPAKGHVSRTVIGRFMQNSRKYTFTTVAKF